MSVHPSLYLTPNHNVCIEILPWYPQCSVATLGPYNLLVLIRTKYYKNKDQIRTIIIKNMDLFLFPATFTYNHDLEGKFQDTIEIKWANPEAMVISLQQGNIHATPLTYKFAIHSSISAKKRTKIKKRDQIRTIFTILVLIMTFA